MHKLFGVLLWPVSCRSKVHMYTVELALSCLKVGVVLQIKRSFQHNDVNYKMYFKGWWRIQSPGKPWPRTPSRILPGGRSTGKPLPWSPGVQPLPRPLQWSPKPTGVQHASQSVFGVKLEGPRHPGKSNNLLGFICCIKRAG